MVNVSNSSWFQSRISTHAMRLRRSVYVPACLSVWLAGFLFACLSDVYKPSVTNIGFLSFIVSRLVAFFLLFFSSQLVFINLFVTVFLLSIVLSLMFIFTVFFSVYGPFVDVYFPFLLTFPLFSLSLCCCCYCCCCCFVVVEILSPCFLWVLVVFCCCFYFCFLFLCLFVLFKYGFLFGFLFCFVLFFVVLFVWLVGFWFLLLALVFRAESVHIAVLQAETIMVIRPFLDTMSASEMHAIMTNGFSTVAGGALAAYVLYGVSGCCQ